MQQYLRESYTVGPFYAPIRPPKWGRFARRSPAADEIDSKTRETIQLQANLMENGFTENETPPYSILVRVIPGYHVSITQFGNQQLSPELVEQIGIKTIRDKLADSPRARGGRRLSTDA